MSFKTLTTVILAEDGAPPPAGSATEAAIRLAVTEDAQLEALCIGIDLSPSGFFYGDSSLLVLHDAPDRALAAAREAGQQLRRRLGGEDLRWSVETALSQTAGLGTLLAQRARFSDLVVLNRPAGAGRNTSEAALTEAALFDAGTPVLLIPQEYALPGRPRRIVLGWNRSPEALAAIRAALPWLRLADHVDIAIVDPADHGPERSDPGGALAQWLSRHGVRATISVLARSEPRISETLLRHLRDQDADLLVTGAYGHSRLREAIFGGVTRHLLEAAPVPLLLAR